MSFPVLRRRWFDHRDWQRHGTVQGNQGIGPIGIGEQPAEGGVIVVSPLPRPDRMLVSRDYKHLVAHRP